MTKKNWMKFNWPENNTATQKNSAATLIYF